MDMDYFLLGVIIVMTIVLLIANVYILIYFQHDDDKNTAYFPKFLVVFGLFFAEATVLLLPLDVANKTNAIGCKEGWNTTCGNIDMDILWIIVFMSVIIFIVVLIPYSIYYYEAEDVDEEGPSNRRWIEALKLETATIIAAAIVMTVLFITVSKSNIPLKQIEVLSTDLSTGFHNFTDGMTLSEEEMENAVLNEIEPIKMTLEVSFPIYITGLVSFVGWFGFTIFTGIGLVALPMDLILSFLYRPQYISADVYAHQKLILQKKSLELIELGKSMKAGMDKTAMQKLSAWEKRKQKKLDFVSVNKFKQAVYLLENDAEDLKLCHEEYKNYNPLVAVGKFILGIICAIISFIWVFHIALYMIPPIPLIPFLNTYFIWFDRFFPLFGTISVGIFSTYLLAAAVKGCFKFGMRCFCFALHPMKLHRTYMNSMLFNLGLILFCAIPTVQFCDDAFRDYGRLTAIRTMLGIQVRYLQGFSFFWEWNIFVYALLSFTVLTLMYLLARPKDTSSPLDGIRKKIEKQARETGHFAA